jgi:carboxymethylenebutenolidase
MAIRTEVVRCGDCSGYLAIPARAELPLPAVVVIQEITGITEHMEDVTRRIAAAGYLALAPDLYAVKGERPQALGRERVTKAMTFMRSLPPGSFGDPAARDAGLAKLPEAERAPVGETLGQMFAAAGRTQNMVFSLRSAVHYLREERPESRQQKVGCVGFCMGGGLSALLACEEPELSACVVYYGGSPAVEKVPGIACPVLGFYGEKDVRVTSGVPAFDEAMLKAGKSFEHHVYPGAMHAFFNDDGGAYDVRAVRDSFPRMLAFFQKHLTS